MDQAPRFRLAERQTLPPMTWFELAVRAADTAFILAAGMLGMLLVMLLAWQNVAS